MAATARNRNRRHRVGRQHHGTVPFLNGAWRTAHCTRPNHDRHGAGRRFSRGRFDHCVTDGWECGESSYIGHSCGAWKSSAGRRTGGFPGGKAGAATMRRVARTRNEELYLLVALAIGFATAAISQAVGLSLAAGAFLAGMIVSSSEFGHETLSHLLPLRDTFVALFFVTVGALIRPSALIHSIGLIAVIVLLVVLGKFVIRTAIVVLFRYPLWMSVLVGVGLTQIGEFSFVLVRIARSSGLVGEDVYNGRLAASVITILLNAVLMRLAPAWVRERQIETEFTDVAVAEQMHNHIVICGFGRIGSLVGTAMESFSLPYVVVETDPDIVRALRARSVPCIYGNAAHLTILERTHIDRARLVVLTVPDKSPGLEAVRNIRRLNAAVPIIARAHRAPDREDLLKAGATEVIHPEIEASAVLVSSALQHLPVSGSSAQAYTQALRSGLENAPLPPPSGDFPVSREIRLGDFEDDGQSLAEAHVRERFGVTIIAVNSPGGETLNPPAATTIRSGDRLRVFGLPKQIAEFEIYVGARAKT